MLEKKKQGVNSMTISFLRIIFKVRNARWYKIYISFLKNLSKILSTASIIQLNKFVIYIQENVHKLDYQSSSTLPSIFFRLKSYFRVLLEISSVTSKKNMQNPSYRCLFCPGLDRISEVQIHDLNIIYYVHRAYLGNNFPSRTRFYDTSTLAFCI